MKKKLLNIKYQAKLNKNSSINVYSSQKNIMNKKQIIIKIAKKKAFENTKKINSSNKKQPELDIFFGTVYLTRLGSFFFFYEN